MRISECFNDGANWQAQAVLAYIKPYLENENVQVVRYENCREQGYIFFKRVSNKSNCRQLNIAVYEHRNSDTLCIVVFEKFTKYAPKNTDVWDNMKDKWDYTKGFNYGSIVECGKVIVDMFDEFNK